MLTVLFTASQDGKWGLIDREGRVVLPLSFDGIGDRADGMVAVVIDGRFGLATQVGRMIIEPSYGWLNRICDGYCVAQLFGAPKPDYGYLNYEGEQAIPFEWDGASPFACGIAQVRRGKRHFLIDRSGVVRADVTKYAIVNQFVSGRARVHRTRSFMGVIGRDGHEVVPCERQWVSLFWNGYAVVQPENGPGRLIDMDNGTAFQVNEEQRNQLLDISDGIVRFKDVQTGLCGFMDMQGEIILPPRFGVQSFLGGFRDDRLPETDFKTGWGYINSKGELAIPYRPYSVAEEFNCGRAVVQDSGSQLCGLIDVQGNHAVAPKYDDLEFVGEGVWRAKDNGHSMLIDCDGEIIWVNT